MILLVLLIKDLFFQFLFSIKVYKVDIKSNIILNYKDKYLKESLFFNILN
jgi:hypothetical protein